MTDDTARGETGAATTTLALAGIAAPLIFAASTIAQGFARPDYSAVSQMISELAAYPGGWIQNATFYATGALMAAFGIGLRRSVGGIVGPVLVIISGFGLIVAGAIPVHFEDGALVEPPGHIIGSLIAFWGAAIGYIILSRPMAADPAWKGWSAVALVTGIAIILLFFLFAPLSVPPEAPLHPWVGLTQRAMIGAWMIGALILAIRLRKVAATG